MSIASQNWDGVSPPSLPAGWNIPGGLQTTAATGGITPTSSPNMLETTTTSSSWAFATYATLDGNGGNVQVQASFNCTSSSASKKGFCILTARGSATTLNQSSTTFYFGYVDLQGQVYELGYYSSGTPTILQSGSIAASFVADAWYAPYLQCVGSSISLGCQRLADGAWLTLTMTPWVAGSQQPFVSLLDSTITGQGYSGLAMVCTLGTLCTDDWVLTAASVALPPNRPVIVSFPLAYYPQFSE